MLCADEACEIGEAPPLKSYLDMKKLVDAAKDSGCDAVHPGYGFLAENPEFASMVKDAGLIFVGPKPETISLMGDKIKSKEIAHKAGVPVVPFLPEIKSDGLKKAQKLGAGQYLLPVRVQLLPLQLSSLPTLHGLQAA